MITPILLCVSIIFATPTVEKERIGTQVSLSSVFLKGFTPSLGAGVNVIFITGEKLGASLGFQIIRNKGRSLYSESMSGIELISSTSSKYITLTGFELNYAIAKKKLSPFIAAKINWVYFHEQSKNVYYTPGWKITTWKNYQGMGYCLQANSGVRYIVNPSFSLESKLTLLLGNFSYPPLEERIYIRGLSFSLGIRL